MGRSQLPYDVFILYSHADEVWSSLLPQLEAAGPRVCIDERDFAVTLCNALYRPPFLSNHG